MEAGLPDGVINFTSSGSVIGKVAFGQKEFAGVHFTGSNETFNSIWRSISENLSTYRSYPRIVGETAAKTLFLFIHQPMNWKLQLQLFVALLNSRAKNVLQPQEDIYPSLYGRKLKNYYCNGFRNISWRC